jgi:hypothetical protein
MQTTSTTKQTNAPGQRDFSATTNRLLGRRGVRVTGLTTLPNMASDMPYANGERGYIVNDNGTQRIWTFAQVVEAAGIAA